MRLAPVRLDPNKQLPCIKLSPNKSCFPSGDCFLRLAYQAVIDTVALLEAPELQP